MDNDESIGKFVHGDTLFKYDSKGVPVFYIFDRYINDFRNGGVWKIEVVCVRTREMILDFPTGYNLVPLKRSVLIEKYKEKQNYFTLLRGNV